MGYWGLKTAGTRVSPPLSTTQPSSSPSPSPLLLPHPCSCAHASNLTGKRSLTHLVVSTPHLGLSICCQGFIHCLPCLHRSILHGGNKVHLVSTRTLRRSLFNMSTCSRRAEANRA
jgi:hypothetical protein